jgi:hypothetical protein
MPRQIKVGVKLLGGSTASTMLQLKLAMAYYLKLFTSQYQNSTNLLAWQTALMTPLDDLATCIEQFNYAYSVDVAVGNQLDVLGEWIGISRTVPFQPTGGVSPVLDDTTYRLLLEATIFNNTWDSTIASLYKAWNVLFPNGRLIIQDNQNMTANISHTGAFTSIVQDLINNGMIVPRPEGVLYNPTAGPSSRPYFGYDLNTSDIAGFDTGHFT